MGPVLAKRLTGALRATGAFTAVTMICLVLIEGITSWLILLNDLQLRSVPSPTQLDVSLGWVGRPDVALHDYFGPGKTVTTNSRGFRGALEFDSRTRDGSFRIICSGDSFAFGSGVDDHETWCHRLASFDPRFETVNAGVAGYGLGQVMLAYEQRLKDLKHQLHIVAFIDVDFGRSITPASNNYGRPVLRVEDGQLSVGNVPVPWFKHYLARIAKQFKRNLRSIEFGTRLMQKLVSNPAPADAEGSPAMVEALTPMVLAAFERIERDTKERGAQSVFVYLPARLDYFGPMPWEIMLIDKMTTVASPFINVAVALRELPASELPSHFIPSGMPGGTHYTAAGNEWVAHLLYAALVERGLVPQSTATVP